MFLLDDILLAPVKGLAAICRKVHEAAQEDLLNQEKEILAALADLHQQLEALKIGEADFDSRECELLDRLDVCQQQTRGDRPNRASEEDSPVFAGKKTGTVPNAQDADHGR